MSRSSKEPIHQLVSLMARLRDPDGGCPWDLEQEFKTVAPYTLEEAYEVVDAIEQHDLDALKGELGDLLFQVVFHARMAEEQGAFNLNDVIEGIVEKMTRRHPHVFGDAVVDGVEEQSAAWEQEKRREHAAAEPSTQKPGPLGHVTQGLPALARAEKLQRRAARFGIDSDGVLDQIVRIRNHLDELDEWLALSDAPWPNEVENHLSGTLFEAAGLARHLGLDAEQQLRAANQRLVEDVALLEQRLSERGERLEELSQERVSSEWERFQDRES